MLGISKKGQMTIWIIVAILVVGIIAFYFLFFRIGENVNIQDSEFNLIFSSYDDCIRKNTENAISIIGTQGGRIDVGDFSPGSEYMPFSSHLNFLGFPVPYWYYLSGNGLIKENVPTKKNMEEEIASFLKLKLSECDLSKYKSQGYRIDIYGEPEVKVSINDLDVSVVVSNEIVVSKEEKQERRTQHRIKINSKLGKFYNIARGIYEKEKRDAFLENFSLDILRLYAPFDGVELSCSPQIWRTSDVFKSIREGLEANINSLKVKGKGSSSVKDKRKNYFIVDYSTEENVNFVYNSRWPTKIEIYGDGVNDVLMVAEPVGTQEGMGIMGFCYSPYHFVYDVAFPVLIQIYDDEELFQFPVAVIIDKNMPRNSLISSPINEEPDFDLCKERIQDVEVTLRNINLNLIEGNLSFQCFNQKCALGSTTQGKYVGKAPICLNGILEAKAPGYATKKVIFSTNEEEEKEIIMDREYEVELKLRANNRILNDNAIISFNGNRTVTTALPEGSRVMLSEGSYNVVVYIFGNSSITLPGSVKTQCIDVPSSGLLGFFGVKKEKCYNVEIPETKIESALIGGGKGEIYLLPSDLEKGTIILDVGKWGSPSSLEEFQKNYEKFETSGVSIYYG